MASSPSRRRISGACRLHVVPLNIQQQLLTVLTDPIASTVIAFGEVAADLGSPLYIVGGAVRDALAGRPVSEADLVIVGDIVRFSRRVQDAGLATQTATSQFMTIKLRVGDREYDVATARRETYGKPGALPDVEPADLETDLARRDFSVNAMAASLSPGTDFGTVTDPHRGASDLERTTLRALRPDSFRDDSTRVFRAARYATRLGLRLDPDTARWIERGSRYVSSISADRLRNEFERCWEEPEPEAVLHLLDQWSVLPHVHPALRWRPELGAAFKAARAVRPGDVEPSLPYWAILGLQAVAGEEIEPVVARLNIQGDAARAMRGGAAWRSGIAATIWATLRTGGKRSEVVRGLDRVEPAVVVAAAATEASALGEALSSYLAKLRGVRPFSGGDDLLELGVPEGPLVGDMLKRLLDARLDGDSGSVADDRELIRQWMKETRPTTGD